LGVSQDERRPNPTKGNQTPHHHNGQRGVQRGERVRLGEVVEKVGGFILSLVLSLKVGRKDECVGVRKTRTT